MQMQCKDVNPIKNNNKLTILCSPKSFPFFQGGEGVIGRKIHGKYQTNFRQIMQRSEKDNIKIT